jgi:hypothetical protein
MNKIFNCIVCLILLNLAVGCQGLDNDLVHKGDNLSLSQSITVAWDSIVIDAFYTSGQGNYFMIDSIISFADHYYAKIYNYDCWTGELLSQHFGLGQGPNESNGGLFLATPIINDTSIFMINNNIEVDVYNTTEYKLNRKGMLNFGWADRYTGDYDSPKVYTFMLMSDLGADIYNYKGEIIIPLQPVYRYACKDGLITSNHFKKSHIFGLLDFNSMKITKVFGHYPVSYLEKSLPQFDFFRYFMHDDLLCVNFPTDSLIYVYKYPDQLEHVFGYECNDIDRNYTRSNTINDQVYDDFANCGMNTGIYDFPELQIYCRTYIKDMKTRAGGMQIYNYSFDLISEIELPLNFKLLGYFESCFYGVTLTPEETDDNTFVTFYKGKIVQ